MSYYLQLIKDSQGNNYLGIVIPNEELHPYLTQLQEILKDSFEQYTELQQKRDSGKYHMTFLSVPEFNSKISEIGFDAFSVYVNRITKVPIEDLKLLGLGTVEKSENKSYFVVCKSNTLQQTRTDLGFDEKDFHITLGFKWKDIHGVRKDQLLIPTDDFLKKLKYEFQKEGESFEFIKGLKNFDLNIFKLIEPIKINDTSAIFRCGDNDYIQVSLIDDRFTITGKWQDTNKLPIISDTLIQKKFKQIN